MLRGLIVSLLCIIMLTAPGVPGWGQEGKASLPEEGGEYSRKIRDPFVPYTPPSHKIEPVETEKETVATTGEKEPTEGTKASEKPPAPPFVLTGVFTGGDMTRAIIYHQELGRSSTVRVGMKIKDYIVTAIHRDKMEVRANSTLFSLPLGSK